MAIEAEAKAELQQLLRRDLPAAEVVRIDLREVEDRGGEHCLNAKIVFKQRPPEGDMEKANAVMEEFRNWLVLRDDCRFCYFSLVTEQEDRDRSS